MGEELKIDKDKVIACYKAAQNKKYYTTLNVLKSLFGEDIFKSIDTTEYIKTFEDACEWCLMHDKNYLVTAYQNMWETDEDVAAYLKLRIICAALNEGWEFKFTANGYKWLPCFTLLSKDEYEKLSVEKQLQVRYKPNRGAFASDGASYSNVGIPFAFKSEKLASYAGKQFIDIWSDYLFK